MNANTFLVGCDPEFVVMAPPVLKRARDYVTRPAPQSRWGFDHQGWVMELQPQPSHSCLTLVKRMRETLKRLVTWPGSIVNDAWLAPTYVSTEQRMLSLGGHVHLDIQPEGSMARTITEALDRFTAGLVKLDILPLTQSALRQAWTSYGQPGDVRWDHGRMEYRSMGSWLFSGRTSILALTGAKLAAVAPEEVPEIDSIGVLKGFFEKFKGRDDDADWILNRGYFEESLVAKTDVDMKTAWRVA